jgi:sugar/nucleoside kinase (ribokinase family)
LKLDEYVPASDEAFEKDKEEFQKEVLKQKRLKTYANWYIELAKKAGTSVLLDLDFRPDQWHDPRAFGAAVRSALHCVDIVVPPVSNDIVSCPIIRVECFLLGKIQFDGNPSGTASVVLVCENLTPAKS